MSPKFEVVVGTYEQYMLGYKFDDIVKEYDMERTFAMHSHLASIRSVASKKNYLASAAADNTVCLYDMRHRMENGKLTHHSDTINCISFTPDASHIITGSKDGSMAIIRCGNWQIEKHWESPHKGLSVDTLAIHPTGKLALTTGGDGVLRTWNLIKGRQAYATNLIPRWKADAKFVSVLKWSPSGKRYAIGANKMLDIFLVATAGIERQLSFDCKVICAEFLTDDLIAVGLMDGKLAIYNFEEDRITFEIAAHSARLRCMVRDGEYLVTASSDGEIKVWSIAEDSLTMLNKANCDARILCMTLSMAQLNMNKTEGDEDEVEKEAEEDEDDEDDEDDREIKKKGSGIKGCVRLQRVIVEDEGEIAEKKKKAKRKKNKRNREDGEMTGEEEVKRTKKLKVDMQKRKREESEDGLPKKREKVETEEHNGKKNKKRSLDREEDIVKEKKMRIGDSETGTVVSAESGKKKRKRKRKNKGLVSHPEAVSDKKTDENMNLDAKKTDENSTPKMTSTVNGKKKKKKTKKGEVLSG